MRWRVIKEKGLFVSLLVFHFTFEQSLYAMCLTFFSRFRIMGQRFKERKKKAGVGGREFKNTTNINREKKERKEVLDFFFSFRESLWNKKSVTLFCFGLLRSVTLFFKKVLHFIFFPFLGKEMLHLEVEEDNHWASKESIDMYEWHMANVDMHEWHKW